MRGRIHIRTSEGYFSIFKRGITGIYHQVSAKYLKRYLGEFGFRYNERTALGIRDSEQTEGDSWTIGKRPRSKQPRGAERATA